MRKTACILGVGFLLASGVIGSVPESVNIGVVSVCAQMQASEGGTNWKNGYNAEVVAVGIGIPPQNYGVKGKVLARRAAIVDAYRNLSEELNGVQVDSETVMENLIIKSDVVRMKTEALVKGAVIVSEQEMQDGTYKVTMKLPMYGATNSVASVIMPAIRKQEKPVPLSEVKTTNLSEQEVKLLENDVYTGIVVDARGLGLQTTFAPVVYDTNGRVVYGLDNLDYQFAMNHGMVAYATSVEDAKSLNNRGGTHPLVLKATAVRGGKNSVNKVNVVVSPEDGDRILLACRGGSILQKASVVFIK